jgi:hypothetical protein
MFLGSGWRDSVRMLANRKSLPATPLSWNNGKRPLQSVCSLAVTELP